MSMPIGSIIAYALNVDGNIQARLLADGWLLCDGSPVSRTDFRELFEALDKGRIYGRGDGANTFNLPDYRGYFLRGVDDPDFAGGVPSKGKDPDPSRRRYPSTGEPYTGAGSVQDHATALPRNDKFKTNQYAGHSHSIPGGDITDDSQWNYDAIRVGLYPHMAANTGLAGEHAHIVVEGGDSETRPANVAVNWLIRAK